MNPHLPGAGLYTDLYELTMAQGYLLTGRHGTPACFDYFFRDNPFGGGYAVFAGLDDLLGLLEELCFDDGDLDYLKGQGFQDPFLRHLRDFRFRGTLHSVREGEVVFPLEPIVRVEGSLLECQLIETLLLNVLNFQSLIATKASRMVRSADGRRVVDFGLRRAQGLGGLWASRAAAVGGVEATSNVLAAREYGLLPTGTMAHSWIQSYPDELTAFREYAALYPLNCVLLVDTYNTLASGLPNAVAVAREMESRGQRLAGIRLDSGDLAYLSKKARALLDAEGLSYVRIVVSNQLDERIIKSLLEQGAPINAFGVGTHLVTGQETPALDGVYKLCAMDGKPRLKAGDTVMKTSLPGVKKVLRYTDPEGLFYADGILLQDEKQAETIHHPFFPEKKSRVAHCFPESLLYKMMEGGQTLSRMGVAEAAGYARERLAKLSPEHLRFENPHVYKVGVSPALLDLRTRLVDKSQRH